MEKEIKHTQGPWIVSNSGGSVQRGGMVHPSTICILEKSPLKISPEVEANAKLIAAAPDMLSAIERFIHSIEHEGVETGRVVDAIFNAKEILRKIRE